MDSGLGLVVPYHVRIHAEQVIIAQQVLELHVLQVNGRVLLAYQLLARVFNACRASIIQCLLRYLIHAFAVNRIRIKIS